MNKRISTLFTVFEPLILYLPKSFGGDLFSDPEVGYAPFRISVAYPSQLNVKYAPQIFYQ